MARRSALGAHQGNASRRPRVRQLARYAVVPLLVVLLIPAAQAWVATSYKTRDDGFAGPWQWGNLSWQGGKGGIVWGPVAESEDPAGHGTPGSGGPAAPDVFTSPPLPSALFLNASKHLRVDLYVSTASGTIDCGAGINRAGVRGVWVEILVDGTLVGAMHSDVQIWNGHEPDPAGFILCRYRFPTESVHIPSGKVVTLRLVYKADAGPYKYGAGPGHQSRILLPLFPPEETLYRTPELVLAKSGAAEAAPPSDPTLAMAAGGLALMVAGRGRRTALLAAALLATGLAGCLQTEPHHNSTVDGGGESQPPVGSATVSYVDPGESGLANETAGSIIGQVKDAYSMPVRNAYVLLLGTTRSTRTTDYGVFSFKSLPPGTYTLRVDHPDFETLETAVKVRSGSIAKVAMVLAYSQALDAGSRPHPHDYWSGDPTYAAFSEPVSGNACNTPGCYGADGFYLPPGAPGEFRLVRPGTTDIEVRLDFDPQTVGYSKLGMAIQANHDPDSNNWSFFATRGPNEPFHIRTTWEMTDVGHQNFSTFRFGVYVLSAEQTSATFRVALLEGPPMVRKATITLHRGALPLEPPHPDHWGPRRQVVVQPPTSIYYGLLQEICYGGQQVRMLDAPLNVVPQETETVTFRILQTRANGVAAGPVTFGWTVWYHDGGSQPTSYVAGSPEYRKAPPAVVTQGGTNHTFTIPVAPEDADGIYARKSAWRFALEPDDANHGCTDRQTYAAFPKSVEWSAAASRKA